MVGNSWRGILYGAQVFFQFFVEHRAGVEDFAGLFLTMELSEGVTEDSIRHLAAVLISRPVQDFDPVSPAAFAPFARHGDCGKDWIGVVVNQCVHVPAVIFDARNFGRLIVNSLTRQTGSAALTIH